MAHYIGVDLHKAFLQVCVMDETGRRCWEGRYPTTAEGLTTWLSRCAPTARVAVEASGPTWWFVDQVRATLPQVQVSDAARTRLKAGSAAKTDRLDARRLADALRRDSVVPVWYPPPALRDLRELSRYRISLVRTATAVRQRLRALLLRHGTSVRAADLASPRGHAAVAQVPLSGWAARGRDGLQALLTQLQAQLAPIEAAVSAAGKADPIVRALDAIPGIGLILGVTLRAESGAIDRVPDPGHLASYAGVVPRVTGSGGRVRYGAITKRGSAWLRWALVEAAIHGLRRRDAVGRWGRQLAIKQGGLKARIALARALCTEIYRTWPRG
jgi:transposase